MREEVLNRHEMRMKKIRNRIIFGVLGFFGLVFVLNSFFIVQEGQVGILKRLGKAHSEKRPGLHMKMPFIETVIRIDVRQRKNVEELHAATEDQLPISAETSINWTVNLSSVMDLYINYGGLDQFETRILDPKLRSAAKAALARFPANQLIRERQTVVAEIMETMSAEMAPFPITINSPQLENIVLPEKYMAAVEAKESARETAEREKHILAQQKLKAQQQVNTAEANAESVKLEADAEAYRVRVTAEAEAAAIDLVNEQLAQSPRYIDLVVAKQWNGVLPVTALSDAIPMINLRESPPAQEREKEYPTVANRDEDM